MKKIAALILAMLLSLSVALAEDVAPGLQEGVQWGMSVEEVKSVIGPDHQADEREYVSILLSERATAYGADADIAYMFYFGRLVGIGYNFVIDEVRTDALLDTLTASYGLPEALDMKRLSSIASLLHPDLVLDDLDEGGNYSFRSEDGTYVAWIVEEPSLELMFFAEDLIADIYESEGRDIFTAGQADSALDQDEQQEEGNDTFRITFRFNDASGEADRESHAEDNLKRVNDTLAGLALSHLSIEDDRGYLITNTSYDKNGEPTSVEYQYGLLELTLVCKQEAGEDLGHYRMDVMVDPDGAYDSETFYDYWRDQNPDRVVRLIKQRSGVWQDVLGNASLYIVLSTERQP